MIIIPLKPIPNQSASFSHEGDNYLIEINTRKDNLYFTMDKNGVRQISNRIIRSFAFMTDYFIMIDNAGEENPHYLQLGTRFQLAKLDAKEKP